MATSLYANSSWNQEQSIRDRFKPRQEVIEVLTRQKKCDVLVVGGGIHGAVFAHLSRFNGLETVLLEKRDYTAQPSGYGSEMVLGGIGCRELLGFRQVLSAIRAREDLFETAAHLVNPYPFLFPIREGEGVWGRNLSLWLNDLIVNNKERRHRWISAEEADALGMRHYTRQLKGCFQYIDGIMDNSRLVMDHVIAARQEGALCLNYAQVDSFMLKKRGGVSVGWTDNLTGEKHELLAGIAVNCAGPWVPEIGRITPGPLASKLKVLQGTNLIFNKKWEGPALLLPLKGKAGRYFIGPHPAGTIVETVEREVRRPDVKAIPSKSEVNNILDRIGRDLPGSELDRSTLHHCFSCFKTVPLRRGGEYLKRFSRKHRWTYSSGVFNLLGGQSDTAAWTAYEGLKKVFKISSIENRCISLRGRKLPGAGIFQESVSEFRRKAKEFGVPHEIVQRTVSRWGSRVRYLMEDDAYFEVLGGSILRGEVELAIDVEQAETLEDILCRRTGLEYCYSHGLNMISEVKEILRKKKPELEIDQNQRAYREKIDKLHEVMGIESPAKESTP